MVMGELVRPHERVQVEQSLKYSAAEAEELWKRAGMVEIGQWRHHKEYGEWIYTLFYGIGLVLQRDVARFQQPHPASPTFPWCVGQSHDTPVYVNRTACRHWSLTVLGCGVNIST
jgi:hypothetical protein